MIYFFIANINGKENAIDNMSAVGCDFDELGAAYWKLIVHERDLITQRYSDTHNGM